MYHVVVKYTDTFHSKALQILPNVDFWFENIPSGNPEWKFMPGYVSEKPTSCNYLQVFFVSVDWEESKLFTRSLNTRHCSANQGPML
jgi:hypothetical protein